MKKRKTIQVFTGYKKTYSKIPRNSIITCGSLNIANHLYKPGIKPIGNTHVIDRGPPSKNPAMQIHYGHLFSPSG